MRRRRLGRPQLRIELGQACGGVERKSTVRDLDDVELVDLIETTGEQPAPRIGRHRLQFGAADQGESDSDNARGCEHSGRTPPYRHRGYPRTPRGKPPEDPPASAQIPRMT